ncbi:MAG: CopG family transcriptional regulator [Terriglobales bacterium]
MKMIKTQVYLPTEDLAALHRIAAQRHRGVADLVREAVRRIWLHDGGGNGPVGVIQGPLQHSSSEHDSAFDRL